MRPPRPLPYAFGIGALAQVLFSWRLTTPSKLMFDEVHYVPAARALLALSHPVNIEHPLLGKAIIAGGIALFGDSPLGWRSFSTVAGTATVMGVFACLYLLFGRVRTASFGSLLVLLNFTVFIQARIAMLDGFMAALVILALAAMLWAMRSERHVATKWLLGSALLGLAAGVKWIALPYIAFAGLAFVLMRLRDGNAERHWKGMETLPALVILGFASGFAYFTTFAPAFFYDADPLTLARLIPFQATIYAEQTQVLPPHTYQSSWWTWAPMLRPIWYLYEPIDGAWRGVLMIGNPAVMWGGLIAVAVCLWGWWRDAEPRLLAAAALWIASYAIWAFIPKSLGFYYYYYLSSIFLCVAIAAAFDRYRAADRDHDWGFLLVAAVLFVWFYPILSATALPGSQAFARWMWLARWA